MLYIIFMYPNLHVSIFRKVHATFSPGLKTLHLRKNKTLVFKNFNLELQASFYGTSQHAAQYLCCLRISFIFESSSALLHFDEQTKTGICNEKKRIIAFKYLNSIIINVTTCHPTMYLFHACHNFFCIVILISIIFSQDDIYLRFILLSSKDIVCIFT